MEPELVSDMLEAPLGSNDTTTLGGSCQDAGQQNHKSEGA